MGDPILERDSDVFDAPRRDRGEIDVPGQRQQYRRRSREPDQHPVAARRTLELQEQQRNGEQLGERVEPADALAPRHRRPCHPDDAEKHEAYRQRTRRRTQNARQQHEVDRRHHGRHERDEPQADQDRGRRRRPRQRNRDPDRERVDQNGSLGTIEADKRPHGCAGSRRLRSIDCASHVRPCCARSRRSASS